MENRTKKSLRNSTNSYAFKFRLGQTVYVLDSFSKPNSSNCPVCDGVKCVTLSSGKSFKCPNCYGQGHIAGYDKHLELCKELARNLK